MTTHHNYYKFKNMHESISPTITQEQLQILTQKFIKKQGLPGASSQIKSKREQENIAMNGKTPDVQNYNEQLQFIIDRPILLAPILACGAGVYYAYEFGSELINRLEEEKLFIHTISLKCKISRLGAENLSNAKLFFQNLISNENTPIAVESSLFIYENRAVFKLIKKIYERSIKNRSKNIKEINLIKSLLEDILKREAEIKEYSQKILETAESKSNSELMKTIFNLLRQSYTQKSGDTYQVMFLNKNLIVDLVNILNSRITNINNGFYYGQKIRNLYDAIYYCKNEQDSNSPWFAFGGISITHPDHIKLQTFLAQLYSEREDIKKIK